MTARTTSGSPGSCRRRIAGNPGIVDAHLQQEVDAPGVLRQHRPHARGPARPQREHHRHQHQCQPELVGAGDAQFLDRPDLRHPLLHRGPDAGARRSPRSTTSATRRSPSALATMPGRRRADAGAAEQRRYVQARQRADQQPTRPTSSRSTRSMPASRAATSAASPVRSARSWPTSRSSSRRATRSRSSARSRA